MTHKVSLYVDDLLLFISSPENSIPYLIEMLRKFGKFSDYRLNFSKSSLFPINKVAGEMGFDQFPFKVELKCFMNLGIHITHTFIMLYAQNFDPLLDRTKMDLVKWSSLPISLAGSINLVKMTVLPRFLYLFQMIPVNLILSNLFLSSWTNVFRHSFGIKLNHGMQKVYLERSKPEGGMGLPNFMHYYLAANNIKIPLLDHNFF